MALHICCLLASVLLASAGAEIYDQGPQTFFVRSSPAPQSEQSANSEFVLYLTPKQAKALENSGALVKPQSDTELERGQNEEPQVVEEQEEPQYKSDNSEEDQKEDSELEEIFKILNQQKKSEEVEQQEEEQVTEKTRQLPARFNFLKLQQEEKKYFAPAGAKKLGPAKSYSYVRFLHPSEKSEDLKPKPYRAQLPSSYYFEKNQESAEQQEQQRPEAAPESENQEGNISSLLQHRKISARILEHRDRLLKNELELQSKLRELQNDPTHNNQKYAIEIEKLRSNLEKQNALSKAEALVKAAPVLIKEEISEKQKGRPVEVKRVKVPVPTPVVVRVPQPFEVNVPRPYALPVDIVRPVPVTFVKAENNETPKPDEEEKRLLGAKNVYVKINKPYLVERIAPIEINREVLVEGPTQKPELTIVRHIWEH